MQAPHTLFDSHPSNLQAAPFIGACRGDVAAVECSEACVDALAPFNELCFVGVVTDDFLQGSSEAAVLSSQQAEEFYKACFPTSGAGSVRAAGSVLTALAALAGAALLLA